MADILKTEKSGRETARLGVDIGGTFTDAALEVGDRLYTAKVLTTHTSPDDGVLTATAEVLGLADLKVADLDVIIHGTTLATNALIERKGAKTAVLTTDGFRDVMEIGFEHRFDLYDLFIDLPKPLIRRKLRLPIRERMGANGSPLLELNETDVRAAAETLRKEKVEAVAVCFMHSYANGAHEKRTEELLREELPGVSISLSSEVAPEMREFERFTTACSNAYVQPKMASYLDRLEQRLVDEGMICPMLMMLSSGGLTTIETASKFPVRLLESGPAGGAVFAASIAAENGMDDVFSFDMGGTTAKLCLIDGGQPNTSRTFEVARTYRFKKGSGMPIRIPVIDMVEIGAGGGSVAHIDALGHVAVGPESAGSEPGPVCYGRGGQKPAVTDADLVLGRIHPDGFAGGRFPLDRGGASTAISENIGTFLSMSDVQAAAAVVDVVEENMSSAARVHAVEGGKDLSERTLVAYGGAAPLHAASVARKLGVSSFLIPQAAGVGSAVGFLRAPVAFEIARSKQQWLSRIDINDVNNLLNEMSRTAREVVLPAVSGSEVTETRAVSMRYVGQGHELDVEIEARAFTEGDRKTLRAAFEERYREMYGRNVEGAEIEILTWSVLVSSPSLKRKTKFPNVTEHVATPQEYRTVFDTVSFKDISCAVHTRTELELGARIKGPAIIEENETTTVVPLGMSAEVLPTGALLCADDAAKAVGNVPVTAQEKTDE